MKVNGLLLILLAVGLGVAYYSGAMGGFIAALTNAIAKPGERSNVVPFPGGKKAGPVAGGNTGGPGITDTGSTRRRVGGIAI